MKRITLISLASVALLTLAGCTGAGSGVPSTVPSSPGLSSTPQASSASTPSSSATLPAGSTLIPTASADEPVLSSEGLGPLRILAPVRASQNIVAWSDHPCGDDEATDFGEWIPTPSFSARSDRGSIWVGNAGDESDPLSHIVVFDPTISTRHGLHVGSPLTDAKALGAKLVAKSDGFNQGMQGWAISGSVGQLAMWVKDDVVKILVVEKRGTRPPFFPWERPCG